MKDACSPEEADQMPKQYSTPRFEAPDALILAYPRSGTHLLLSCLGSHPGVHKRGECVLKYDRLTRLHDPVERRPRPDAFIFVNKTLFMNIGIVMYSMIPVFERLCGPLSQHRVIHLLRNPGNVARSVAQMEADRVLLGNAYRAHHKVGEKAPPPSPISTDAVERVYRKVVASQALYAEVLRTHPRCLTLTYEEITDNRNTSTIPEAAGRQLLNFLGLEYHSLSTTLQKSSARDASAPHQGLFEASEWLSGERGRVV
jgi:hypothetical protein